MMKNIGEWIKEQNPLLVLAGVLLLIQLIFNFGPKTRSARVVDEYIARLIVGRVDIILSNSRGFPLVILSTGEKLSISLPYAGQEYLRAGDSIVKKPGTKTMTTYRKLHTYTEVSVFGGDSTDGEGLKRRYRVVNQ